MLKKKEEPVAEPLEATEEQKRIARLEAALIWIRDIVVNGNDRHVEKINRILRGEE